VFLFFGFVFLFFRGSLILFVVDMRLRYGELDSYLLKGTWPPLKNGKRFWIDLP